MTSRDIAIFAGSFVFVGFWAGFFAATLPCALIAGSEPKRRLPDRLPNP